MSTGEVAAAGMDRNKGEKNNEIMKKTAMEKAVSPVRPPSETPAADST